MRLIVVRHGETDHNRGGLTLGRFDVPLNDRGRAQAGALAASFHRPPDAIYASPLRRALETAGAIAAGSGVAVTPEPGLIEMDVGEMEHLTRGELRERFPDFLRTWLSEDVADARMPGGESLREVQKRAWEAVQRLRAAHPHGEVVAVTHNFVALALVCRALDVPLARFRSFKQDLASRTMIDIGDARRTVLHLNDTSHLAAAGLGDDSIGREAPA